MNEVPDSSLGGLGVLTQHPPSASQNHLSVHSDPTLPFPHWLRIMRKLFQNYKESKINLLLSEGQILCHIFILYAIYLQDPHLEKKKILAFMSSTAKLQRSYSFA